MASPTTRELARDATIGLSDRQVCERTGLSFPTWRKLKDGLGIPSERTILQFTSGLGISSERMLQARAEMIGREVDPVSVLIAALEISPLTVDHRRVMIETYRALQAKQAADADQATAA